MGSPSRDSTSFLYPAGQDETRVGENVIPQPGPVLFHPEEIVPFLAALGLQLMVGALALHQFLIGQESLAANAVDPFVLVVVDIAIGVEAPQHLRNHLLVALLGGANEIVVADVQHLPGCAEAAADLVHEGLGLLAGGGGGLQIFSPCSSVPVSKWVS